MRLEHLAQPPRAPAILPVTLLTGERGYESAAALLHSCAAAPLRQAPPIEIAGAMVRVHRGIEAELLRLVLEALRA